MKKVLAWAVVLARVLSSFTMAFAADTGKTSKDFSDADQIQYTEAVDVMVATGIINGYPDGTFGPKKTVKRSEMAKMISVMLNAGKDIGEQYKDACTFADSKDHWAAGYIAYCSAQHIIDGRSADVFDPEKEVTGTEVAKMALTSLGYDSKIQGYTGEQWAANVLKDANKIDLFKDLDDSFVPGDPCSREAAAQILFNTLQATKVEYEQGTSVSVGDDVSVVVASKIQDVTKPESKDQQKRGEDGFGTIQLWEDVFGKDLQKTNKNADDFGRPAHEWEYKGDSVGTFSDSADYEFIAEKATLQEAVKAFNEDLYENEDVTINYDSALFNGTTGTLQLGDKVELYEKSKNTYDVVVAQYKAYQIKDVDTDVKKDEAKKGITAKVTFDGLTKDYTNKELVGYEETSYVKDAVIAVAFNGNKVLDSYAMKELAKGEVTKTFGQTGVTAVSINDTKYEASYAGVPAFGGALDVKNTYTLYDYNGYYLASLMEEEVSNIEYGVLEVYGSDEDIFHNTSASVKMIKADGKEEIIAVDTDKIKADGQPKLDGNDFDDALVAYTLNDDGQLNAINKDGEKTIKVEDFKASAKMKTNGVIDGKAVSKDVVVFYNVNREEKPSEAKPAEAPKYEVYGFAALEDAEEIVGKYICNKDGEIAAVLLTKPLEATKSILGFITDVETYKNTDGKVQATVKAFVDGKEETYTTVAGYGADLKKGTTLVKFELNKDGELKKADGAGVDEVTLEQGIQDKIAKDAVKLPGTVTDKKNDSLNLGTKENINYQAVVGADVYFINEEGDLEISSYAKIKDNSEVTLYQTDKNSSSWNIVVFKEAATPAPQKYTVTVAESVKDTVTVDKAEAAKGDTITVTVTPEEGYTIEAVTYTVGDGDPQPITATGGNYTFEMPEGNVTVSATFTPAN